MEDYYRQEGGTIHCLICGYQSTGRSVVVRHIEALHFKEKIMCKFCNKIVTSGYNLGRHFRRSHKEVKSEEIKAIVAWHQENALVTPEEGKNRKRMQ